MKPQKPITKISLSRKKIDVKDLGGGLPYAMVPVPNKPGHYTLIPF